MKINKIQCELFFKYKELLLHHKAGLSQKEISDQLKINYSTVRGYFVLLRKQGILDDENQLNYSEEEFQQAAKQLEQDKVIQLNRLLDLLKVSGKTIEYIRDCLKLDNIEDAHILVNQVRVKFASDYTIYANRKPNDEVVYLAIKKESDDWRKFAKKDFDIDRAPSGQPYLWVQVHKQFESYEKIKVIPIADLHYGSVSFNEELFKKYLKYVEETPNVFVMLLGDMIENATKQSVADGVYLQFEDPQEQCLSICKMLAPIQHKIICSVRGNHEKRSRNLGLDPGLFIAEMLDVPYFAEPVYVDVLFNSHRFSFRIWHGRGASRTEGGKLNSAIEAVMFTDFTHFYLSAHVHDLTLKRKMRIVRDVESFTLLEKKQYVVIAPSFLKYFGTYAAEIGYSPPSAGTVVCNLFKNGDYHAST